MSRRLCLSRMSGAAFAAMGLIVFGLLLAEDCVDSHAGATADQSASMEQQGLAFINARCTVCHSGDLITQQRLDRSTWNRVVDKMIKWGAPLSPEERKLLLDYLSAYYSPTARDLPSSTIP